jgi:hypothetical protein
MAHFLDRLTLARAYTSAAVATTDLTPSQLASEPVHRIIAPGRLSSDHSHRASRNPGGQASQVAGVLLNCGEGSRDIPSPSSLNPLSTLTGGC